MGEYKKSDIIKYTRKACGLTREELAYNICDVVTLARYESGKVNPSDEKFGCLMRRMGETEDVYLFPVMDVGIAFMNKEKKILDAVEEKDWDKVRNLIENLRNNNPVKTQIPESKQFLERIEIMMNYEEKKLSAKEAVYKLNEILAYTKEESIMELDVNKVMTETEIMILYNLAILYKTEKDYTSALKIYKRLDMYFTRNNTFNDEKPKYIIYLGYSNVLGLIGKYDESIKICEQEIENLLYAGKANFLYNFYFNIGWNIYKKIESKQEDDTRYDKAKCYIWLAYQLCRMYPENRRNLSLIKEFYDSF